MYAYELTGNCMLLSYLTSRAPLVTMTLCLDKLSDKETAENVFFFFYLFRAFGRNCSHLSLSPFTDELKYTEVMKAFKCLSFSN